MPKNHFFHFRHKSVLHQTAGLTFLAIITTIVMLSSVSYLMMRFYTEGRMIRTLSDTIATKEDVIEIQIRDDRQRTAIFALRPDVQALFNDPQANNSLQKLLSDMRSKQVPVRRIMVYNLSDQVIAQTDLEAKSCEKPSNQTVLTPLINKEGWQGYLICAPINNSNQVRLGTIAMEYPLQILEPQLANTNVAGFTAELQIARLTNGSVQLINYNAPSGFSQLLDLGDLDEQYSYRSPLALALSKEESVERTQDFKGNQVFAAYRYLPSLGWALAITVPQQAVFTHLNQLLFVLYAIGLLLVALASFASILLALRLTAPLRSVAKRVNTLGPDHWGYRRVVKTGDEVQQLDNAIFDMAKRLKHIYSNMELEVKARTKELKERYELDRVILDSVDYGVILTDENGVIIQSNPGANRLLEKKEKSLVGKKAADVLTFCHTQRSLVKSKHPVSRCLKTGSTIHFSTNTSVCLLQPNQVRMPIVLMASPVVNKGKAVGCVVVFRDITAEVQIDHLKSEFISLASHQLRTPLSTMQWYIELLSDSKSLDQYEREYTTELKLATDRMIQLVNALLTAAQLEGEAIEAHLEKVDLTALVKGVSKEMRWLAKDSGISSNISVPTRSVIVKTDPALLHVVLENLFSNAVKYTEKGKSVSVTMKILKNDVQITVADEGIGIPKKDQKMIFTKLYRASNVLNQDADGTGLGLYISRLVITVLGGKITFKSVEGKGTKFTITLPLHHSKKKTRKKT